MQVTLRRLELGALAFAPLRALVSGSETAYRLEREGDAVVAVFAEGLTLKWANG
jgi:hypothetical protein